MTWVVMFVGQFLPARSGRTLARSTASTSAERSSTAGPTLRSIASKSRSGGGHDAPSGFVNLCNRRSDYSLLCNGCTMTHVNQREANRRAWRAKTWAGVWRANGFSRGTIDALLRAEIDSNRRLLGLTRKGLRDIEGIGDGRVREIEAYREQFRGEDA